jgi:hypothetical protein
MAFNYTLCPHNVNLELTGSPNIYRYPAHYASWVLPLGNADAFSLLQRKVGTGE